MGLIRRSKRKRTLCLLAFNNSISYMSSLKYNVFSLIPQAGYRLIQDLVSVPEDEGGVVQVEGRAVGQRQAKLGIKDEK